VYGWRGVGVGVGAWMRVCMQIVVVWSLRVCICDCAYSMGWQDRIVLMHVGEEGHVGVGNEKSSVQE
jgi:hypothetical protein